MPSRLTPRQMQCLRLSATLHDQQIADQLGISVHTVRQHIEEGKARLGVQDRKAARRLLPQLEGGGFEGMAPDAAAASHPAVDEPPPAVPDNGADADRSLYGAYVRLGRWREPPKIGGSRLPLIVLWAMLFIGLVAAVSMLQSVMETLGRLR